MTGSVDDIVGFTPTSPNPLAGWRRRMKDFCFYKAQTIHQLIQFRTPALPCYADRHSLTVFSHGITPTFASYNTMQDYTFCSSVVAMYLFKSIASRH